jgi:hypothetical protein
MGRRAVCFCDCSSNVVWWDRGAGSLRGASFGYGEWLAAWIGLCLCWRQVGHVTCRPRLGPGDGHKLLFQRNILQRIILPWRRCPAKNHFHHPRERRFSTLQAEELVRHCLTLVRHNLQVAVAH